MAKKQPPEALKTAQKQQLDDAKYYLTKKEVNKLIYGAANFRDRCIIKMFAHTGIRRFELKQLDIRDIDFERKRIHIRQGKGSKASEGKARTIPCSDELLSDIKHLIGTRKTGALFQSNRGNEFSLKQINNLVANAGERASINNPNPKYSNINPHLLRHTFSRLWKDADYSIESLSNILGHESVKTTLDVYGTETERDMLANYEEAITEMYS